MGCEEWVLKVGCEMTVSDLRSDVLPTVFAIVPAAGQSLRMGSEHKLLLPWPGAGCVMDAVLRAWTTSCVSRVVVVARADEKALHGLVRKYDVDLCVADPPPAEMKHSIQAGLRYLSKHASPTARDRWMVAPADLPTLTTELIDRVAVASTQCDSIVAPVFLREADGISEDGASSLETSGTIVRSSGHPVGFPWRIAAEVHTLGSDEGLNALLERHPVQWLERPWIEKPRDIDTRAEYEQRLRDLK